MSIRRTKSQKERPHHHFTLSWQPSTSGGSTEPRVVKRQIENKLKSQNLKIKTYESADILAKGDEFETTRRDVIKSLILASFILSLELVIYLGWSRLA